MKLSLAILMSSVLMVASGSPWSASRRQSRESKWDIIHHEYHGPPAPLAKDGRVIDTPEVTEARANHLAIHAETIADLVKIMSKAEPEGQSEAQPEAPPTIPAEIMAMILAQGQQAEPEQKKQPEEEVKEEEVKPVEEPELNNELELGHPVVTLQTSYEGPLAPLGEDGRVLDTLEVKNAKQAHFNAYKEVAKLATKEDAWKVVKLATKEDAWKPIIEEAADGFEEAAPEEAKIEDKPEARAWYEQPLTRRVYVAPVHLLYDQDAPVGYQGPAAPLGEDGRVIDTAEVERAKAAHWRAHQRAQDIAKRHPPKPEDNSI